MSIIQMRNLGQGSNNFNQSDVLLARKVEKANELFSEHDIEGRLKPTDGNNIENNIIEIIKKSIADGSFTFKRAFEIGDDIINQVNSVTQDSVSNQFVDNNKKDIQDILDRLPHITLSNIQQLESLLQNIEKTYRQNNSVHVSMEKFKPMDIKVLLNMSGVLEKLKNTNKYQDSAVNNIIFYQDHLNKLIEAFEQNKDKIGLARITGSLKVIQFLDERRFIEIK